jgi:hypothetical protein
MLNIVFFHLSTSIILIKINTSKLKSGTTDDRPQLQALGGQLSVVNSWARK